MDDERVWAFEDSLWRADEAHYHRVIDKTCLMVTAVPPYIMTGEDAAARVSKTPRWDEIVFSDKRISRPHDGLIVIAYRVMAKNPGAEAYDARCTSTYLKNGDGDWTVVQHHQAPVLAD